MKYIYLTLSLLTCLAHPEDEEVKKPLLRKKKRPDCLADYSSSANSILDELEKKKKATDAKDEPSIEEMAKSVEALRQQLNREKAKKPNEKKKLPTKKKKSTRKDDPTPLVSCNSCFSCKMICTIS